jgi:hypothetical protein
MDLGIAGKTALVTGAEQRHRPRHALALGAEGVRLRSPRGAGIC